MHLRHRPKTRACPTGGRDTARQIRFLLANREIPFTPVETVIKTARGLVICLFLCPVLIGCSSPSVNRRTVDGVPVVEHLDTDDVPCEHKGRHHAVGCYSFVAGEHHVWYSSVAPERTISHEIAHAKGMRHSEWIVLGRDVCSMVTSPGGAYRVNQMICVDEHGEHVHDKPSERLISAMRGDAGSGDR